VHLYHVSIAIEEEWGHGRLTPFKADLDATLACLEPFVGLAAPVKTYASAIALEELAISAAAGAYPLLSMCSTFGIPFFAITKSRMRLLMSKDADEQFNELERRLYLSSDPLGPFRRY
jgi:hypothetical protein